jgi:hypothetical protein
MKFAALILIFLLVPNNAFCQLLEPEKCKQAFNFSPVHRDQPLCVGILIPEEWAETFVLIKDVKYPRCLTDFEDFKSKSNIRLKSCENERSALAEALSKTSEITETTQPNISVLEWYEQPTFWFAVGVVIGASTVGAALTR